MNRADLLVVSATKSEAAHVPAGIESVICGIGKVDAAVAVTAAVLRHSGARPPTVVNIGTAGALRPGRAGLYMPSTVRNHDISADVLRSLGYPVRDAITVPGGDGTVLATGDSFVTDPAVRDALAAHSDLVDMEGFAIARACEALGVACVLVKHVSDDADETAMEWPERVDHSARVLGGWLEQLLG